MRNSRFAQAQIIGMITELEAGMPTAEVCRRHGLSPASFYKFKSKYGGMNVSDTHRLKSLEDENATPCAHLRHPSTQVAERALSLTDLGPRIGDRWAQTLYPGDDYRRLPL
jgi:putative transposase